LFSKFGLGKGQESVGRLCYLGDTFGPGEPRKQREREECLGTVHGVYSIDMLMSFPESKGESV